MKEELLPLYGAYLKERRWEGEVSQSLSQEGRKLARKVGVQRPSAELTEQAELILRGEVEGLSCEVVLWQEIPRICCESSCACKRGLLCVHAISLLEYSQKPVRFQKFFEEEEGIASEPVQEDSWLESLEAAVSVESSRIQEWRYVFTEEEGKEVIQIWQVSLKEGALIASPQRLDFSKGFPKSPPSEDVSFLKILQQEQPAATSRWSITAGMLESLVRSGRAYRENVITGAKLQWSEPREAKLGWKVLSEKEIQPVLDSAVEKLLSTNPSLYLDGNEIGLLESKAKPKLFAAWPTGPVLQREKAEQIAAQYPGVEPVPEAQVSVNLSRIFLLEVRREIIPLAYRGQYPRRDQWVVAKASIQEKGQKYSLIQPPVHLAQAALQASLFLTERGMVILEPPAAFKQWKEGEREWRGEERGPDPELTTSVDHYWTWFRELGIEQFKKAGWIVQIAPNVGHEVIEVKEWEAGFHEEENGWFSFEGGIEVEGERIELQPILVDLIENDLLSEYEGRRSDESFLYHAPDGKALQLPLGRVRQMMKALYRVLRFEPNPKKKLELHAVEVAQLVGSVDLKIPESARKLHAAMSKAGHTQEVQVPGGLQATLRPYQETGYQWMQFLTKYQLNGILADDMGLGKTVQALAHILTENQKGVKKPCLVIAPTSVVGSWQRESAKFTPSLRVLVLQGGQRKQYFDSIPHADLVLTSYALLHRDIERLEKYEFHLLILDEAQYIKNANAQVTKAATRLKSSHRLCLSGTPVENHLGELWSQINFLMPQLLGTEADFRATFQLPIEKEDNEERQALLNARVGPLILRRTKDEVAKDLPPKTELLHHLELNSGQKDLYETVRSMMSKKVRDSIAERGIGKSQIVFLEALLKLRQLCCHPALIDEKSQQESSKFELLKDLLDSLLQQDRRVLIFSQFTTMLSLIEQHLIDRNIRYLKLTGASKNRSGMVEEFQTGEVPIFLISLKAGGTGLTLTAADTVIHYDPWWNPAAENQATDRAYRIGQDKPVFVHKLICKNTVEEKIQKLQLKKGQLANALLAGSSQGLKLNAELFEEIFASDDQSLDS